MMKILLHLLLSGLIVFSGCYFEHQPPAATTFFRDFSLSSTVQRMQVHELQPQSGEDGKSEAFGEPVRRRRNTGVTYLIVEQAGAKFNDKAFIDQLGAEIEKMIRESGLRIDSRSLGTDNFQIDYSQPGYTGSLDIAATRAGTSQFRLWAVLREEVREKRK